MHGFILLSIVNTILMSVYVWSYATSKARAVIEIAPNFEGSGWAGLYMSFYGYVLQQPFSIVIPPAFVIVLGLLLWKRDSWTSRRLIRWVLLMSVLALFVIGCVSEFGSSAIQGQLAEYMMK